MSKNRYHSAVESADAVVKTVSEFSQKFPTNFLLVHALTAALHPVVNR